jgi:hypothetical protein
VYVNGSYYDATAQMVVSGSISYGGTLSEGTWEILDLLSEVFITFPNLHSATSWAEAFDISHKVNIAFHGDKLSDKWTVRYDYK